MTQQQNDEIKEASFLRNVSVFELNWQDPKQSIQEYNQYKDTEISQISKDKTDVLSKKDTFVRSIMSTLRQKINDPLGKRQAK